MSKKKSTERQTIKKWLIDDGISVDEETLSRVFESVMRNIYKNSEHSLRSAYLRFLLEHYLELKDGKFG